MAVGPFCARCQCSVRLDSDARSCSNCGADLVGARSPADVQASADKMAAARQTRADQHARDAVTNERARLARIAARPKSRQPVIINTNPTIDPSGLGFLPPHAPGSKEDAPESKEDAPTKAAPVREPRPSRPRKPAATRRR